MESMNCHEVKDVDINFKKELMEYTVAHEGVVMEVQDNCHIIKLKAETGVELYATPIMYIDALHETDNYFIREQLWKKLDMHLAFLKNQSGYRMTYINRRLSVVDCNNE